MLSVPRPQESIKSVETLAGGEAKCQSPGHPVSPNITILVLSECLTSAWLATTMLIDQTEACGRTLLLVS